MLVMGTLMSYRWILGQGGGGMEYQYGTQIFSFIETALETPFLTVLPQTN